MSRASTPFLVLINYRCQLVRVNSFHRRDFDSQIFDDRFWKCHRGPGTQVALIALKHPLDKAAEFSEFEWISRGRSRRGVRGEGQIEILMTLSGVTRLRALSHFVLRHSLREPNQAVMVLRRGPGGGSVMPSV